MTNIDFKSIRKALADLPSDHDASGNQRPRVEEIFTPEQHANALDPNTPVVVGARGAGKSFWAGVLAEEKTRRVAAEAYPNLKLDRLIVIPGYDGLDADLTPKLLQFLVKDGDELKQGIKLWEAVIWRAAIAAAEETEDVSLKTLMNKLKNPEAFSKELKKLDAKLESLGKILLVTFDALDTLSRDWQRSSRLVDTLFEVVWSLRARRNIKAKLFIRPEQLADENLKFVEMPKLRGGSIELTWSQTELYGLLFWRLYGTLKGNKGFSQLATLVGAPLKNIGASPRAWVLTHNSKVQKSAMSLLAGLYMGPSAKKGGTYDWPFKHLADAKGNVTPRSFVQLFKGAASNGEQLTQYAISPKGIQDGLRGASKVRVEELSIEYQWIKRALLPLAGLLVPCDEALIFKRWDDSKTISTILEASIDPNGGFLPPFPPNIKRSRNLMLSLAMERVGVFHSREDGRKDMPDLFRVAAQMLKKGGISAKKN